MSKNPFLKAFAWTVSITTLLVSTLSAGIVSFIVADWSYMTTGNYPIAISAGIFVFLGFLCSVGAGIGMWIWLKAPTVYTVESGDNMTRLLADISAAKQE